MREDWIEDVLGNIFETVTGNTPSKKEKDNYGSEIPFIKPPQINNNFLNTSVEFLSPKGKLKARILPISSVLVTCIGNLGRIGINKTEVAFNQQINAVKPISGIESKFTFYQAQTVNFRNQLEQLSTSTTVALVNKSNFNSVKFKIAPLVEQKAIVKKIEELFSSLDSGIADLKKAQDKLVIYRQAVLRKAFEGELTKKWRKKQTNLPSADELLEQLKDEKDKLKGKSNKISKLSTDEISDLFDLPKNWKWASTDYFATNESNSICAGPFGTIFKAKDFRQTGIPIIFLRHVKANNYNTSKPGFMDKSIWEKLFQTYSVFGGELLITKLGEPPGVCAIYPEGIGPAMVTPDVIKMSVNESFSSKKYLMYYFNSVLSRRQYEKAAFGTTRLRVTIPIFRKLPIPFCSIIEQKQIVREIESRLSVCDKVEESITESLEKAIVLRQSILKKAFEGTLLSAEEIVTCKADKGYEPAGVLLERIKKEKV